jgi:hypothetical protein
VVFRAVIPPVIEFEFVHATIAQLTLVNETGFVVEAFQTLACAVIEQY